MVTVESPRFKGTTIHPLPTPTVVQTPGEAYARSIQRLPVTPLWLKGSGQDTLRDVLLRAMREQTPVSIHLMRRGVMSGAVVAVGRTRDEGRESVTMVRGEVMCAGGADGVPLYKIVRVELWRLDPRAGGAYDNLRARVRDCRQFRGEEEGR